MDTSNSSNRLQLNTCRLATQQYLPFNVCLKCNKSEKGENSNTYNSLIIIQNFNYLVIVVMRKSYSV